jgi:hypothetical protein
MKTPSSLIPLVAAALFISLNAQLSTAFAQGSLTPPGPPAPTMKSLDQVQPRTPIAAAPYTITQSGSYYLTTNLNVASGNAITINANQVTLDLNGFTISSTEASPAGTGILLASSPLSSDVTIRNGHITGSVTNNGDVYSGHGFASGISYSANPPYNVRVSDVSVSGCLTNGISLSIVSTTVESCTVQTVGNIGIEAGVVSHSTAVACGLHGILADTISDSHGESYGSGSGVYAFGCVNNSYGYSTGSSGVYAANANNCYGYGNIGTGVTANIANNCYGYSVSGYGLYVTGSAIGCFGQSTSGVGIFAHIANSCTVGGGTTNITYKYNMP